MIVTILMLVACQHDPLQIQKKDGTLDCWGCNEGNGTIGQPPVIASFAPQQGIAGTKVKITGSRFSATPSYNTVKFNGIVASVLTATTTQLVVVVPGGAVTGTISVNVSGLTGYSSTIFSETLIDIPRTGLIAFYPFTENGNEEGHNNNALKFSLDYPDSPGFVSDRFGLSNHALTFNGVQLAIAPVQIIPQQPWTISFWVKYNSLQGFPGCFASMSSSVGLQATYAMTANGWYRLNVSGDTGPQPGGEYLLSNPAAYGYLPPAATSWYNITLSYDGSAFKVYRDGTLVESTSASATTVPGPQLLLGRSGESYFVGQMDDLAIYNRALPPADVTKLVQQTISKY